MLKQTTVNTIKSTAPLLKKEGLAITTHFYTLLFEYHPELWNIFNHANQKRNIQQKALADSLYAAALHIDQLENILPVVKKIAHKHRSVGVKTEHYPIVGKYLLISIKEVLGEQANKQIMDAWEDAYNMIADVFISVEKELYNQTDWKGFRPLVITKRVIESHDVMSLYLQDENGNVLNQFTPGQYVSVKIETGGYSHIRQYSLSNHPNEKEFRISVKRERGCEGPDGIVSSILWTQLKEGDTLRVSSPAGNFTYDNNFSTPLVLISGGQE